MAMKTKTRAYIMLRGEKVLIKEIHTLESETLLLCHGGFIDGVIPLKIKSRCLEKALEFCEKRGQLRRKHTSPCIRKLDAFDRQFYNDVKNSDLNLVDLYHAAARLGIDKLENMLFNDVYSILCEKTPEQLDKLFKVRYNNVTSPKIIEILGLAPPCPNLSKEQLEEINRHHEEILQVSTYDLKTLSDTERLYWLYAHLIIKRNPGEFVELNQISRKEAESDEEDDEEEISKVPKNDHDVGGPGPRGIAWKTTRHDA